jgi:hypothetical protein
MTLPIDDSDNIVFPLDSSHQIPMDKKNPWRALSCWRHPIALAALDVSFGPGWRFLIVTAGIATRLGNMEILGIHWEYSGIIVGL